VPEVSNRLKTAVLRSQSPDGPGSLEISAPVPDLDGAGSDACAMNRRGPNFLDAGLRDHESKGWREGGRVREVSPTEREKMLAGEGYNCHDAELSEMAIVARRRVAAFCALDPGDEEGRFAALQTIFGHVERGVHIESPFYADYGVHTSIGHDTFINVNFMLIDDAPVSIGQRCLFGPAVQLVTAKHPLRASDRRTAVEDAASGSAPWRTMSAPITVGDDVWLGSGVIVLPGVTIGDRSTVGAGSVVTDDVPPDSLALGAPAKVVRRLN
jgi:maltose O-acetyltransferase